MEELLKVEGLHTYFHTYRGVLKALTGVSFSLYPGEILGLVGETGCGKSVTARSIMRLIKEPGKIEEGKILYRGKDLLSLSEEEMRTIRGKDISMIFQEPMTSLNPVLKIGTLMSEVIMVHKKVNKNRALNIAKKMLKEVKMPDPEGVLNKYPFELSGGMRQRVMIAMALSSDPEILIADEPTTALDVTIQGQILRLIIDLSQKRSTAVLLITHDLGVVANVADRVIVMYAGNIVEEGRVKSIFTNPSHPYTKGLLRSLPSLAKEGEELPTIPGTLPNLIYPPKGCLFYDRCDIREEYCKEGRPERFHLGEEHYVWCHKIKNEKMERLGYGRTD